MTFSICSRRTSSVSSLRQWRAGAYTTSEDPDVKLKRRLTRLDSSKDDVSSSVTSPATFVSVFVSHAICGARSAKEGRREQTYLCTTYRGEDINKKGRNSFEDCDEEIMLPF